ncbi:MAG: STAS domain-containing protein [Rhodospirillales bacterium]
MSELQMTQEQDEGILIYGLGGRLDSTTAKELEASLKAELDGGRNAILMDMKDLDYISSAGLRVVLLAAKHLRGKEGRFALSALKGEIRQVFEISGLLRILTVHDDRATALDALKR